MRKAAALGLPIACFAALAGYAAWAAYKASRTGDGWAGVIDAWPYLLAGAATAAGVLILFIWLAFYSDRHGYDRRAGRDEG